MSAPSEPEKYSIDEMMDRLKSRPAEDPIEDGELVTRADGTQAIRVRKKKRRSHQPHKEDQRNQRRARVLQVSGALIILLLGLFGAGIAIVFANSAPFREGLVRQIALSTGARAELQQFRVNPTRAIASSLTLNWPAGNVLGNLTARGINADISPVSFLGNSMAGAEMIASDATLTLRLPREGEATRETPAADGPPPIRFDQYNIPKFHLLIGDPAANGIRLSGSEASFIPAHKSGRTQLLLNRGDITIKGCPKLRMDRSHIEFHGNEMDIISMRLRHESEATGDFELNGSVAPYAVDRASILAVRLDAFLLSGLVGPELGQLFSCRIDTVPSADSNTLSFTPGPDPAPSLVVTFRNSGTSPMVISGFRFLSGLAHTLDDTWYARPVFDSEIRGTLSRTAGNVLIGDLHFENKGRMALRGMLTMSPDRRLSGELDVGVAEGMIKTSENRRLEAMFGPPREGFRWITLTIKGTANSPTDNFEELYSSTAATGSPAPAGRIPSFEDLTRPK